MVANLRSDSSGGDALASRTFNVSLSVFPTHMLMNSATRSLFARMAADVSVDSIGVVGTTSGGTVRVSKFASGWKTLLFRRLETSIVDIHANLGGESNCPRYRALLAAFADLCPEAADVAFYTIDDHVRRTPDELRVMVNILAQRGNDNDGGAALAVGVYVPAFTACVTRWLESLATSGYFVFPDTDTPFSCTTGSSVTSERLARQTSSIPRAGNSLSPDAGRESRAPAIVSPDANLVDQRPNKSTSANDDDRVTGLSPSNDTGRVDGAPGSSSGSITDVPSDSVEPAIVPTVNTSRRPSIVLGTPSATDSTTTDGHNTLSSRERGERCENRGTTDLDPYQIGRISAKKHNDGDLPPVERVSRRTSRFLRNVARQTLTGLASIRRGLAHDDDEAMILSPWLRFPPQRQS